MASGYPMKLERLSAHNFKSFRDLDVELGQLNVLIGANGSGKSNFVRLLAFLRDIATSDLDNAVSLQGGSECLFNFSMPQEPLRVDLRFEEYQPITAKFKNQTIDLDATHFRYQFSLLRGETERGLQIGEDRIEFECHLGQHSVLPSPTALPFSNANLAITNAGERIEFAFRTPSGDPIEGLSLAQEPISAPRRKGLILERFPYFPLFPPSSLTELLPSLKVFDFDAKLPKQGSTIAGKIDLEEDAGNLTIALKNILESEAERRLLTNLLRDTLPFVGDLDVERFAHDFLHFRLLERYDAERYVPASMLSDGTIGIIALIVALYFSDQPLIVIEEPERNIHPYLVARVAELLKDASRNKQIVVTTHSPELVKNVALDTLLLVARDRTGFSTIQRPSEMNDVRVFLDNEVEIADLFTHDLLGA